eukprot:TRINITY_DN9856_c0_g1_i1.p1 TRINITY_DN9856_c0_g1~~TRINITY_DN9856_c0_g1_i1.p1  ORF type:complete len:632 (+),score=38.95 TRINITY_DN9856_c0_g1_i1:68-1963(+)
MLTQATTPGNTESGQHDGSSRFIALALCRRVCELEDQMAEYGGRQRAFETRINGFVAEALQTVYMAMQEYAEKTKLLPESMEKLLVHKLSEYGFQSSTRDSQEGKLATNDSVGSLQTESRTQISKISDSTASHPEMMYGSSSPSSLMKTREALAQIKSELTASDMSLNLEFNQCLKTISDFPLGNTPDSIQAASSSSEAGARKAGAAPSNPCGVGASHSYSAPGTFSKETAPCGASDKLMARDSTASVEQKDTVSESSDLILAAFPETVKRFSSYPDSGATQWAASSTPRTTSQALEPAPAEFAQCTTAISEFQSDDFQVPIQTSSSSSTAGACSAGATLSNPCGGGVVRSYSVPGIFSKGAAPCGASDKLMARNAFTETVQRSSSYPDYGVTQQAALTPRSTSRALEPAPKELIQSMAAISEFQTDDFQAPIQNHPSNSAAGACIARASPFGSCGAGTARRNSVPLVHRMRSSPCGGSAIVSMARGNNGAVLQSGTVKEPSGMHQAAFAQPLERFPPYPGSRVMHEASFMNARLTSLALSPAPVQEQHRPNITAQSPRGINLSPRSPRSPRSSRAQLAHSASVACNTPGKPDERYATRAQDSGEQIALGLSQVQLKKQTEDVSVKKTCTL